MQKTNSYKSNQVRIIGGLYRSRKLTFPDIPGLRPTGDRIRETLFNWLTPYIVNSRCLDLFTGSGALGIESLSRGAEQVTFIDSSHQVCEGLRRNLNIIDQGLLASGRALIICTDSQNWLRNSTETFRESFNIAFLDPPFHSNLTETCSFLLEKSNILANNAFVYIEKPRQSDQSLIPSNWTRLKDKTASNVSYQLFGVNPKTSHIDD